MNSLLRKEKDMYSFIPFEKEGVKACFTTRNLDFSFKNNPYLHRNHSDILKRLKVNNRIGLIEQVHGRRVYIYKPMLKSKVLVKADAIITDNLNTPITIRVADCVGIFIFDKVKRVGSLVHSGWRGTQKKILTYTINKMINNFSCFPKDLIAAFGPCIRKCCYEVDRGFGRIFKEVEFRNGKYYLDLVKNNFNQLVKLGVEKRNIFDSGICSSCSNGKFFSYRREGESAGRTLELLMIKGEK